MANQIAFIPLRDADTTDLWHLLNDQRVTKHMPLAEKVDLQWVEQWKTNKSGLWPTPEMGPWAVMVDGALAGWVGVQPDGEGQSEFAIVLNVWAWGLGGEITRRALERWAGFKREDRLVFYLPKSRPIEIVERRLGFQMIGEGEIAGQTFVMFALPN